MEPGELSTSNPSTSFTIFPLLPLEIRNQIWRTTLPGPRIMQVMTKGGVWPGPDAEYYTPSFSWGGQLPVVLSVSRESRAEALRHLTPRIETYWNLELDTPYFEEKIYGDVSARQLYDCRMAGLLDGFRSLAVDWKSFGEKIRVEGDRIQKQYQFDNMRSMPSLKSFTFIYTDHTLQRDLVDPGVAWTIGPLSDSSTLNANWRKVEHEASNVLRGKMAEDIQLHGDEWMARGQEPTVSLMGINGRKREYLDPAGIRGTPPQYMNDWFA